MMMRLGFGRSLDIGTWTYGLLAAFIQGGAGAVSAGLGVSVMDPKDWNPGVAKFYTLMGIVFLINGGLKMMAYLNASPLPAWKTVTKETKTLDSGPPKTVTTVTETHQEPIDKPKE